MAVPGSLLQTTIRKTRGLHWHDQKSDNIEQSMWLDGSSQDLSRSSFTLSSDGQKELIVSIWVKRLEFGRAQEIWILGNSSGITSYNDLIHANFNADDTLTFSIGNGGGSGGQIKPTRLFRDQGWYHLLFSFNSNTSVANAFDRLQLYVNGIKEGVLTTNTAVPDNQDVRGSLTGSADFRFGRNTHPSLNYFHNAYMAQACYLEGKSLQAGDFSVSDFLDTWPFGDNGTQFVPKKTSDISALASTVGGNSFCLDFADSSAFGNDIANNNDFSDAGSPTAANQTRNSPSLEYPVFNILQPTNSTLSFSEGNLRVTGSGGSDGGAIATLPLATSGTTEFQVKFNNGDGRVGIIALDGVQSVDEPSNNCAGGSGLTFSAAYHYAENGSLRTNTVASSATSASFFDALTTNDVVTVRYNADANELNFLRNNSATGSTISTLAGLTYYPVICRFNNYDITAYFDESKFPYTIGTGNNPVNTKNQTGPEYQGIDTFDVVEYEGNGGGQRVGDFVPFTDAYTVTNSVIFDDGDSRSLTLNSSATRTSATVAAYSIWVKRGNIVNGGTVQRPLTVQVDGNNYFGIHYNASDQLDFTINNGGATILQRITTRVFEDTASWHNIVVIINQADGTQADRVKIFYDGVQIPNTSAGFGTNTCSLDGSSALNFLDDASSVVDIGGGSSSGFSQPFDGYIAEVVYLDGADSGGKLDASHFGQVDTSTNRWVAKDPGSYTFGNTGYYLEFKVAPGTNNGAGTDTSGRDNHFTSNGAWATTDQSNDAPSNNLPVLDSADTIGSATPTLTQGNLTYNGVDNGGRYVSGFPLKSGKWYWEIDVATAGSSFYPGFFTPAGVAFASTTPWNSNAGSFLIGPETSSGHWLGAHGDGTKILYSAASGASPSGGPGGFIASGDRMFFAYDADNKYAYIGEVGSGGSGSTLTYYTEDGTASADPTNASGFGAAPFGLNLTGEDTFYFGIVSGGTGIVANLLFDSTKWNGTPPTGYKALTQDNLDNTTDKITSFAWIKNRDAADSHQLATVIEGANNVYELDPNTPAAAVTAVQNKMQRFLQRGVQIGNDVTVNTVNESYVLWQWMADSITPTDHAVGSIDGTHPQLSSKTLVPKHGAFSIMTYEGNETGSTSKTVAHGMGGAPEAFWVRNVDTAGQNTPFYHKKLTATKYILMNQASVSSTNVNYWADTEPTATLFTVGTGATPDTNDDAKTFQAVAFRSVPGVCKVGSYTGNNSATGPYITCDFKPRWVMIKRDSSSDAKWVISDTQRTKFNSATPHILFPSESEDEDSSASAPDVEFFHDGFRLTNTSNKTNSSGTYIYVALAEIGGFDAYPPIYGR
jgi:hypothetical protein